jgi:DNA-binding MarR family transcriptional regulator/N-acetylglutamate synthase-like GNAT family acetyltransferase
MHEPVPASEVAAVREASRRLVRELGFMRATLAGTSLPPSAVHALIEIGNQGATSATRLCELLMLDKSSTSRMLHKLVTAGEVAARVDERDGRTRTLSLTAKGRHTLAEIDRFAQRQVAGALDRIAPDERQLARRGLAAYAGALQASRTGLPDPGTPPIAIRTGYLSGVIGRTVEMHARFYAAAAGFGPVFESKVAAGLAEFVPRLDRPPNQLWSAVRDEAILGTIAIDGEDLGPGVAHLRWFIVDEGLRGSGTGRRLLTAATQFCDRHGFRETRLWTFRGLDAARRLYEASGFVLTHEEAGRQWGREVIEQQFVRSAPP